MRQIALPTVLAIALFLRNGSCVRVSILHTNDVHGRFEQVNKFGGRCPQEEANKCYGGSARLKTKVDEIRKREENVLFLNAGDYYQGTLYFNLFKGDITSRFMNRLGYNAMALGNHEFDDGVAGLVPFLKQVKFPVLICNMNYTKEERLKNLVKCQEIIDVKKSNVTLFKIAILGYLTPETTTLSNPGRNISFTDEIESLKKAVEEARKNRDVKLVIALGHSGFAKDLEIAEKVKGIDVVIGGHTNTFLYNGKPPIAESPEGPYPVVVTRPDKSVALVVEAYAYGLVLGRLDLECSDEGVIKKWTGQPIVLDSSVEQDAEVLVELMPYQTQVEEYGKTVVGTTDVRLQGDAKYCRMRECNMGNMLTDSVLDFYRIEKTGHKDRPIRSAIWGSGGIRASIDELINKGKITMADVMLVAPFANTIDIVDISGKHLIKVMEHSVSNYDSKGLSPAGGFLQMSGIKVEYDLEKPVGHRITSLMVMCPKCREPKYEKVIETEMYLVAAPTFMVQGGDGYVLKNKAEDNVYVSGDLDSDIIVWYLNRTSPVFAAEEGRIGLEGITNNGFSHLPYLLILIGSLFSHGLL